MNIVFSSQFLSDVSARFSYRRRAIANLGRFGVMAHCDDGHEWLEVIFALHAKYTLIFQLGEDNYGSIYLRSDQKSNRGKVLVRVENVLVCGNAILVVKSFEKTIKSFNGLSLDSQDIVLIVKKCWKPAILSLADDSF